MSDEQKELQKYESKKQEYDYVQQERISRINTCYTDGAMLASFFLIYYATIITGLIPCLQIENANTMFLLFGLISAVAFFFPIIVLRTFAVKFIENISAICNLAAFSVFYHEKPAIIETNDIEGIKWESLHKDTMFVSTRYESKEYFLLALASLFFQAICFVVLIYLYAMNMEAVNLIYFISIIILQCCFFAVGSIVVYKIHATTNISNLAKIDKDTQLFYEMQWLRLCGENKSCEILDKIEKFRKEENALNSFILENRIPDYKSSEIVKMFYGKIKECEYSKKIRSSAAKRVIKKAEKSGLTVHDYIIKNANDIAE